MPGSPIWSGWPKRPMAQRKLLSVVKKGSEKVWYNLAKGHPKSCCTFAFHCDSPQLTNKRVSSIKLIAVHCRYWPLALCWWLCSFYKIKTKILTYGYCEVRLDLSHITEVPPVYFSRKLKEINRDSAINLTSPLAVDVWDKFRVQIFKI